MCNDIYVRMCEKLEELQKEWKPRIGDACYSQKNDYGILLGSHPTKDEIWLPTLEQLVEMMPKDLGYTLRHFGITHEYEIDVVGDAEHGLYDGEDIKVIMLQALIWSCWGKEWDEAKGEWVKTNVPR